MLLVKRSDITEITMIQNEHNDFCVVFHLGKEGRRGKIILPCFSVAEFSLHDPEFAELKEKQIRMTKEYLDSRHPDGFVRLSSQMLYDMNVYH